MTSPDWTAANWQAHIVAMPSESQQDEALERVPSDIRARVRNHVLTVRSLKRYHQRIAEKRGYKRG